MELKTVPIEKPADINFILGQSHVIKTIEDLHEAIVQTVPQMKFGIAFCESSGPALVRWTGNDEELLDLAKKNALALSCGHCFIIFMSSGFPINILNTIKAVPEVCAIYCATSNSVAVIVAETDSGRGILGVIDGMKSKDGRGSDRLRPRTRRGAGLCEGSRTAARRSDRRRAQPRELVGAPERPSDLLGAAGRGRLGGGQAVESSSAGTYFPSRAAPLSRARLSSAF